MKKKDFLLAVKQTNTDGVHRILEGMDQTERSACAPAAISLYKQVYRWTGGGSGRASDPQILDFDAAVVAVLGTASLDDILALKRLPLPLFGSASSIYGRLQLPWLQDAVEHLLTADDVSSSEPLWRDGLCNVPRSDAVIHGYFDNRQSISLDEGVLLNGLVWRFFETEGKGNYSLPVHDRECELRQSIGHTSRGLPWAERLLGYERQGALNRDALLSASLKAISIMRRPAEIRWFAAFFEALEPTREELLSQQDTLMELALSSTKARSSFAKRIQKNIATIAS